MEQEDLSLALAEISATLAALSGVAGILRPRSGEAPMPAFDILLLRNVALISMVVALFALLPLTLRGPTTSSAAIWRACSVVGVALLAWNVVAPGSSSARRYVLALMCALGLAGINFIVTALRPGPPAA